VQEEAKFTVVVIRTNCNYKSLGELNYLMGERFLHILTPHRVYSLLKALLSTIFYTL